MDGSCEAVSDSEKDRSHLTPLPPPALSRAAEAQNVWLALVPAVMELEPCESRSAESGRRHAGEGDREWWIRCILMPGEIRPRPRVRFWSSTRRSAAIQGVGSTTTIGLHLPRTGKVNPRTVKAKKDMQSSATLLRS